MRRYPALALVLGTFAMQSACKPAPAPVPEKAEGPEHIACAVAGDTVFKPACAVERVTRGDTLMLVVRHPDGAFRRFEVVADGRGLAVADGADDAVIEPREGGIDVKVGGDRYRFPATVKARDAGQ